MAIERKCAAFIGDRLIAEGDFVEVALTLRQLPEAVTSPTFLVFDETSGKQMDFDLRGSESDVVGRLQQNADESGNSTRGGRGRPKLGVVAREVTLLPRHWEWLNSQPGGASVALRKLVDEARKGRGDQEAIRTAQDAAYCFMSAKAGNLEGFEEASRALYRSDKNSFLQQTKTWPEDIRNFALKLADAALKDLH